MMVLIMMKNAMTMTYRTTTTEKMYINDVDVFQLDANGQFFIDSSVGIFFMAICGRSEIAV